jgi:hypothetical protein
LVNWHISISFAPQKSLQGEKIRSEQRPVLVQVFLNFAATNLKTVRPGSRQSLFLELHPTITDTCVEFRNTLCKDAGVWPPTR